MNVPESHIPVRRVQMLLMKNIDDVLHSVRTEVIFGDCEDNGRGELRVLPPYVHNFDVFDKEGDLITEKLTEKTRSALIDLAISGASHVY